MPRTVWALRQARRPILQVHAEAARAPSERPSCGAARAHQTLRNSAAAFGGRLVGLQCKALQAGLLVCLSRIFAAKQLIEMPRVLFGRMGLLHGAASPAVGGQPLDLTAARQAVVQIKRRALFHGWRVDGLPCRIGAAAALAAACLAAASTGRRRHPAFGPCMPWRLAPGPLPALGRRGRQRPSRGSAALKHRLTAGRAARRWPLRPSADCLPPTGR